MFSPLLLLGLYVYFHIYLQRLWEELAYLPAIFPDGRPLDKKAYPWLINGIIRVYFIRLRDEFLHLSRIQVVLSMMLAWGAIPVTIISFWVRYLPRHDWIGTSLHIFILVSSTISGVSFYHLACATLEDHGVKRLFPKTDLKKVIFRKYFYLSLGLSCIFLVISLGAINGVPSSNKAYGIRTWVPRIFMFFKYNLFADLQNTDFEEVNLRQTQFQGANFHNANLQKTNLGEANLRWTYFWEANLQKADLQGADLRKSNLHGADLKEANLLGACLEDASLWGAQLQKAKLWVAKLQNADLQWANLQDAELQWADLQEAKLQRSNLEQVNFYKANLMSAHLQGACLKRANLQETNLQEANFQGANLQGANLRKANLHSANFQKANLAGADLSGTTNLTEKQIKFAILDETTLLPEYLKVFK